MEHEAMMKLQAPTSGLQRNTKIQTPNTNKPSTFQKRHSFYASSRAEHGFGVRRQSGATTALWNACSANTFVDLPGRSIRFRFSGACKSGVGASLCHRTPKMREGVR
jgi:hypothetical protein